MLLIQRLLASYRGTPRDRGFRSDGPARRVFQPAMKWTLVATLSLAIGSSALAQDPAGQTNPFGGADPFGGGTAVPATQAGPESPDTEPLDPLLYAITKQDLSQPTQRLLAAETLFLLKRPDQANKILDELKQPLTGSEAYDFVFAVTSSRLLWVQSQGELSPAAGTWLSSTLANAMAYSNSEESANAAIAELLNGSVTQQTAATEKLLAQGLTAAMPLLRGIQTMVQSGDMQSPQLRRLVQVIQAGPTDWDVTLRSMVGSESELETAAIIGLAARSRAVLNQAAVLEWTVRQPDRLPEPALDSVISHWRKMFQSQHGFDPAQHEFTSRWLEQANQAELAQWNVLQSPRTQFQGTPPTMWLWDASVQNLTPQLLDPVDQVGRNQALLATAWLRVAPENDAALRNYVAAQFKRAKLLNGVDLPLPTAAVDVAAEYLTPVQMTEMLLSALENQQWLVAQALLESLQTVGNSELLVPSSGNLSPVVLALKATDQRVRSAAVQTILAWNPEKSFSGASYFNQGLRELLSNPIGTYAMVASMNPYHSAYLEGLVRTSGWNATVASSAGQLVTDLDLYPATFLIITDSLGEVPYLTVVDQVRATAKGKTMPILLLVRPENLANAREMLQVERNDHYTLVAEFSENGRDLLPWIERMGALKEVTGQVSNRVALEQAERGLASLSAWLGSDRSRRLLDFATFAPTARGLMGRSPAADRLVLELLSHYGDAETQVYLASIASDASAAPENRSAAAVSFRRSVERFGTLLTSKQIESQYDRQNQSRDEGPFTQAILNSLLDTLEARSKRVPFVELPPVPGM